MAKIIEYLASDPQYPFTVNTAAPAVTSSNGVQPFRNPGGKSVFTAGDGFILLSYGIMLPENFTFYMSGTPMPYLNIFGQITAVPLLTFPLPCFKEAGLATTLQNVLEENKEHEIDGFCNYNDIITFTGQKIVSGFILKCDLINPLVISMLNVPAAANAKAYYAIPFIKVAHNSPLM
jgi:hypothetical protein